MERSRANHIEGNVRCFRFTLYLAAVPALRRRQKEMGKLLEYRKSGLVIIAAPCLTIECFIEAPRGGCNLDGGRGNTWSRHAENGKKMRWSGSLTNEITSGALAISRPARR